MFVEWSGRRFRSKAAWLASVLRCSMTLDRLESVLLDVGLPHINKSAYKLTEEESPADMYNLCNNGNLNWDGEEGFANAIS